MSELAILMFGAGATGRGHLSQLLVDDGIEDIVYVEKNMELVNLLNGSPHFTVTLLTGTEQPPRVCTIQQKKAIHRSDIDAVANRFCESDIILTAVIGTNLPEVADDLVHCVREKQKRGIVRTQNIICCENLDNASDYLHSLLKQRLGAESDRLLEGIGFPNAMISRVVPLPTPDPLQIVTEDYNEWTVDKSAVAGEIPLVPCIEFVDNLPARLERKLWIHNGGHATLAYAGILHGYAYIHEALADEALATLTVNAMHEIGTAVIHKHGFAEAEIRQYEAELGRRGGIAEMKDQLARVVRDPLRKLGLHDRLVAPALYAAQNNLPHQNIIRSIVNVLAYSAPGDEESIRMRQIIETDGVESLLHNTLGVPEFLASEVAMCRRENSSIS